MSHLTNERREHPRSSLDWTVRISSASERRLPEAQLIDGSVKGILMVLAEPAGFAVSQSLVVSIEPHDDAYVLVGDVVRVERGTDFRTYVAVELRETAGDDLDRWRSRLAPSVVGADPAEADSQAEAEAEAASIATYEADLEAGVVVDEPALERVGTVPAPV